MGGQRERSGAYAKTHPPGKGGPGEGERVILAPRAARFREVPSGAPRTIGSSTAGEWKEPDGPLGAPGAESRGPPLARASREEEYPREESSGHLRSGAWAHLAAA